MPQLMQCRQNTVSWGLVSTLKSGWSPVFAGILVYVGAPFYAGYLVIRTGDMIRDMEKNPVGLALSTTTAAIRRCSWKPRPRGRSWCCSHSTRSMGGVRGLHARWRSPSPCFKAAC